MGRRKATALLAPSASEPSGELVLSTMHGFGNRIRSIAGAWSLASELNRRLHVVWHVDESCGAKIDDVLDLRLDSGDIIRCNTLLALSAAAYHKAGSEHRDKQIIACYEPFLFGSGDSNLYSSDILPLAADTARCAHLIGSSVPATLHGRHRPPPRDWAPNAKTVRRREQEHVADGRARGAFYRAMQPSAAVRAIMAPVLARIDVARKQAAAQGRQVIVVGVHIRQGDALDKVQQFFLGGDLSGGAHNEAFVARFADEMARVQTDGLNGGRDTLFFVASDQERARRQLRERFGSKVMLELQGHNHATAAGNSDVMYADASKNGEQAPTSTATEEDEGRVGRGIHEMRRAVAEWMMLAKTSELIIRAVKSSFSAEAPLANNVPCIEIA